MFHFMFFFSFLSPPPPPPVLSILYSIIIAEEKPFKLDVFEDYLYMTTIPSNAVIRLDKFGKSNITYLIRGLNKANDIIIVHEKRQTKSKFIINLILYCPFHYLIK